MTIHTAEFDRRHDYADLLRAVARGPSEPPAFRGEQARFMPLNHNPITIGRDPACHLELDSRLIAPRHAIIEGWPEGFAIHDCGSRTGTFINGRGVLWAPLKTGD